MAVKRKQDGVISAHLFFIDIVGYSKLYIDVQEQQLELLENLARDTEAVKRAENALVPSSTGDGFVLVFFTDYEAPLHCAIEISDKLKAHPDIRVRIGLHSGPVKIKNRDIAGKQNVTGDGVNMAQRVMDCGDAGHILASDDLVKVLSRLSYWKDCFHDLGEVAVKHGVRVHLYNFHNNKAGNPATPSKVSAGTPPDDSQEHPVIVSNIPRPPVIGFVARRDADGRDIVESLREKLAPQQKRLVTLSGPGGIGKTTLGAETARELVMAFDSRVVWSSAEGRADFTLSTLLDDISTQLGRADLRPLAPDAKEAEVHALVADPPALVVLDNYETIGTDAQQRIEAWFKRAQCSALFTSRPRVGGFAATSNVVVDAMSPEEAQEFLERVIRQTQDAQIFSQEVRRRIYETAEANPYVMQWVVGQIDAAQEPQTVLEELTHGTGGDAAERVFDRSFNLPQLGDEGRAALLALSLFAPSASRAALAAVAGFGDDSRRLNEAVKNLRALWLIKALDANSRFTVEGLTRSLAKARLSKDPRAAEFRQRFVAYFLRYAKAHAQTTPEDFAALEAEKDNALNAMDAAFEMKDWDSVIGIRYALEEFLDLRGYWDEAIQRGELAVKAARSSQAEGQIAALSHNVAVIYQQRGELEEARRLYDESLEINRRLSNQSGIAISLHELGRLAQAQGEVEEARRLYNESLEIAKRLGNQSGIAITLHQLAILAQNQGEVEEARRLYNESLEINRRLSNQSGIAYTLHQLGWLAEIQGEVEEARRLYNESLEIKKRLGDQRGIAYSLAQLGLFESQEGNKVEAVRLTREALGIFEKLKSPSDVEKAKRQLERLERKSS